MSSQEGSIGIVSIWLIEQNLRLKESQYRWSEMSSSWVLCSLVKSNIVYFSLILSNEIDGANYEMDGVKHEIDGVNNKIDGGNHVK